MPNIPPMDAELAVAMLVTINHYLKQLADIDLKDKEVLVEIDNLRQSSGYHWLNEVNTGDHGELTNGSL